MHQRITSLLVVMFGILLTFASTAQAQWSGSFTDRGVMYTLEDTTVGSSTTHTYVLTLDTTGYNQQPPATAYLDAVDIKAWDGTATTFTLLSAPSGPGQWSTTSGPTSGGPSGGCGGSNAGFACAEAQTKGQFGVLAGNPYTFQFQVTALSADVFATSPYGVHVGAVYADASGNNSSFGITSVSMVPEPGTYAMLVVGLGLLGGLHARRSKKQHNS